MYNDWMNHIRRVPGIARRLTHTALFVALFLAMAVLFATPSAQAACGSTTDIGDESDLNAAIAAFNGAASPCVFTIRLVDDIDLSASPTKINNRTNGVELVINGAGNTLDGQNLKDVRPLTIEFLSDVTINDLTVTGGNAPDGGGILTRGNLTVNDSTITGNRAYSQLAYGGGITTSAGATLRLNNSTIAGNFAQHKGGGLSIGGHADIVGSTISGNTSGGSGGGISNRGRPITIQNSTVSGNTAQYHGGGIDNEFELTLDSVTISHNTAGDGTALYNGGSAAKVTIRNSILANRSAAANACVNNGGTVTDGGSNLVVTQQNCNLNAIFLVPHLGPLANHGGGTQTHALLPGSPAIDQGNTGLTIDQRGLARPQGAADDIGAYESTCTTKANTFAVGDEAALNQAIACFNIAAAPATYTITVTQGISLTASTVAMNNATSGVDLVINGGGYAVDGQGIKDVRVFNVAVSTTVTINDMIISGGNLTGTQNFGAGLLNAGNLTLNRSTVRDNAVDSSGGGIANAGTMTISDSTISGNTTASTSAGGGGIYNFGKQMTIRNSTISGNTANNGGGIRSTGVLNLDSVTISDNTARQWGGGLFYLGSNRVFVQNSLLVGNHAPQTEHTDCQAFYGSVVDNGHNLMGAPFSICRFQDGVNGTFVGVGNPGLGPLADNGGPTLTHALLPGSPAIDTGATTLTTDQRGESRALGVAPDIGAFETEAPGTVIITKRTAPAGGTGFDFTNNISTTTNFSLDDGQSQTFNNVPAGDYTVTEAAEAGYRLVGLSCSDSASARPSSVDVATRTATIAVEPGETVTCIFTNSADDFILVEKQTYPAGGTGFDFTVGGVASGTFTLDDGQAIVLEVVSGTTTITETQPAFPYYIDEIYCDVYGPGANDSVTVHGNATTGAIDLALTNGQAVLCTFVNHEVATITTVKDALPADGTDFSFELGGPVTDTFQLDHAVPDDNDSISASQTYTLRAGDYTIQEVNLPSGWHNENIRCRSGSSNTGTDFPALKVFIDLQPGDDVICTYRNGEPGTITFIKDATPADDTVFEFTFTGSDRDGNNTETLVRSVQVPTDPDHDFTERPPGTYIMTETLQSGWTLTGITCKSALGNSSYATELALGSVNIQLGANDDVDCTFTNVKNGSITIVKDADPADNTAFAFGMTGDGGYQNSFTLQDSAAITRTVSNLPPGKYDVSETLRADWTLEDISCQTSTGTSTHNVSVGQGRAEIVLGEGSDVVCTFQNSKDGSITVVKDADPADDTPFEFALVGDNGYQSSFSLQDTSTPTRTFSNLSVGEYAIFEGLLADWSLTNLACQSTLGTSTYLYEPKVGAAGIDLAPGDDVTCTFTNAEKRGTIVIKKASVPTGASGFAFGGSLGDFSLNDGGTRTFIKQLPGSYTVTENAHPDFELSGLTCVDSIATGTKSTGNVNAGSATINLDPGETVTCTFTSTEDDTITVEKVTLPPSMNTFDFSGGSLGDFSVNVGASHAFTGVQAGGYTISEADPAPAGYALTGISCVDSATGQTVQGDLASRSVDLNLVAGERIHCTFENTKLGTVIIKNGTAPAGGTGFAFSGDLGDFTLDDGGTQTITNVAPGTYSVTETVPSASDYALSGLTCVDSDPNGTASSASVSTGTATLNVDIGETVTCTFTNTEEDTITVENVTLPATSESFGFDGDLGAFSLAGGSSQSFTGLTAGSYTIRQNAQVASAYSLTDIECVDSASGLSIQGNVADGSVSVALGAGERVHCTFTNTAYGPFDVYLPIMDE